MKKGKEKKSVQPDKLSGEELLDLVISEFKDKDMFPAKTADAKEWVRNMIIKK